MYAHDLHCPTNLFEPEEVGVCDRCYRKFYLRDLRTQWDIRGNSLQNLQIRVCPEDYDAPAEFLRPIIIRGPEGVVRDPRPPQYAADASSTGPDLPVAPNSPLNGVITD